MAEPATQSPYISSSAGGVSSEAGGRDLKGAGPPKPCAAGVYLTRSGNQRETNSKSTLSEEPQEVLKGQGCVYGTNKESRSETGSEGSPHLMESPFFVGSKVHTYGLMMEAASLAECEFKGAGSLEDKTDLNGYDQQKEPTLGGESKVVLLTNPEGGLAQPPAQLTNSHFVASWGVPGEALGEKDSPESPFEVIADKVEFDKEFKDVVASSSNDVGSNWVMHNERELLTDIPEDSVCEFQAKPRNSGRISSGPGLSRQSSGTTAALEEVSKCVREMHTFTNELLNWDLIPKDLDGKSDDVVNSGFLASSSKSSSVGAGPVVSPSKMETEKAAAAPHPPLTISLHSRGKQSLEAEGKEAIVGKGTAVAKSAPPGAVQMKNNISWPNSGLPEMADGDSSGESDDTVIEDRPAGQISQHEKPVECDPVLPKPTWEEPPSSSQEGKMSAQAPECNWGSTTYFRAVKDETNAFGGQPTIISEELGTDTPSKARQALGSHEPDWLRKGPKREDSPSTALGDIKEAGCPSGPGSKSSKGFVNEGLKAKGAESPEDPVEMFSEAELKAARSHGVAPYCWEPPQAKQDFEQEHVTITALQEVGRKAEMERPASSQFSPPCGRRPGQHCENLPDMPATAPKSALEKRPLCLEQAIDVKLVPATVGLGKPSQTHPPRPPVPHTVPKLLAEFSVRDLIFWRDVKKTGVVFSTTLILLLSLAAFSVISVVSYLILALLSVTICFRVYKSVIQAVQKSEEGHPFKAYLDMDVALSSETFNHYVSSAMVHINHILKLILRLFLVEDLVDSLKLAVVMWLMTYVGAIFNGITLLILGELLVFSAPVVYEKYKTQIDHYVGIVRDQIKTVVTKIQAKVPGAVKKKAE